MTVQTHHVKLHTQTANLKLDHIQVNDWNPNFVNTKMMSAIKDDIQRHGFIGHIVVQKKSDRGKKNVIINGEHRYMALKELGAKEIPCIILDVDDKIAKLLTLRLNREHGELMPDKVADLLKDIQPDSDMEKLADITAMDQRELSLVLSFGSEMGKEILPGEMPAGFASNTSQELENYILWDWSVVESAVRELALRIKDRLDYEPVKYFAAIYAIPNGGLIPARLLARELNFFQVETPDHQRNIYTTIPPKKVRPILIVDDIYDSGKTYQRISKEIDKEQFEYAVLATRKDAKLPHNVTYGIGLPDKRWLRFPWEYRDKNERKRKDIDSILGR